MKKTKTKNTSKELRMIQNYEYYYYNNLGSYDIYNVYEKPSYYKIRAWEKCEDKHFKFCDKYGYERVENLIILGRNCMSFSCAFRYYDETGKLRLHYFTKDNTYDFEILPHKGFYYYVNGNLTIK